MAVSRSVLVWNRMVSLVADLGGATRGGTSGGWATGRGMKVARILTQSSLSRWLNILRHREFAHAESSARNTTESPVREPITLVRLEAIGRISWTTKQAGRFLLHVLAGCYFEGKTVLLGGERQGVG